MRLKTKFTLTYDIQADSEVEVGLGAGFYDKKRANHSTGFDDRDFVLLRPGHNSEVREFIIPKALAPGRYELVAEIWPANQIGHNKVEVLAEKTCGLVRMP